MLHFRSNTLTAVNGHSQTLEAEAQISRYLNVGREIISPTKLDELSRQAEELFALYRTMCDGFIEPDAIECSISEPFRVDSSQYSKIKTVCLAKNSKATDYAMSVMDEDFVTVYTDPEDIMLLDDNNRQLLNKDAHLPEDLTDQVRIVSYHHRECLVDMWQRPFRIDFNPATKQSIVAIIQHEDGWRLTHRRSKIGEVVPEVEINLYLHMYGNPTLSMAKVDEIVIPTIDELAYFENEISAALRWCKHLTDLKGGVFVRQIYEDPNEPDNILVPSYKS